MRLHPQITDSLFAISNFLLFFTINKVGFKPVIPGIADIEISIFFLILKYSKLLIIFVSLHLKFFLILL